MEICLFRELLIGNQANYEMRVFWKILKNETKTKQVLEDFSLPFFIPHNRGYFREATFRTPRMLVLRDSSSIQCNSRKGILALFRAWRMWHFPVTLFAHPQNFHSISLMVLVSRTPRNTARKLVSFRTDTSRGIQNKNWPKQQTTKFAFLCLSLCISLMFWVVFHVTVRGMCDKWINHRD